MQYGDIFSIILSYNGFIKINSSSKYFDKSRKFIIKISGIWETKTEIGITYKIFDANKIN